MCRGRRARNGALQPESPVSGHATDVLVFARILLYRRSHTGYSVPLLEVGSGGIRRNLQFAAGKSPAGLVLLVDFLAFGFAQAQFGRTRTGKARCCDSDVAQPVGRPV